MNAGVGKRQQYLQQQRKKSIKKMKSPKNHRALYMNDTVIGEQINKSPKSARSGVGQRQDTINEKRRKFTLPALPEEHSSLSMSESVDDNEK